MTKGERGGGWHWGVATAGGHPGRVFSRARLDSKVEGAGSEEVGEKGRRLERASGPLAVCERVLFSVRKADAKVKGRVVVGCKVAASLFLGLHLKAPSATRREPLVRAVGGSLCCKRADASQQTTCDLGSSRTEHSRRKGTARRCFGARIFSFFESRSPLRHRCAQMKIQTVKDVLV